MNKPTQLKPIRALVCMLMLGLAMAYPYLPGSYDPLAVPLSTLAQVFGIAGLLLVPTGFVWLIAELRQAQNRLVFARIALGAGVVVALLLSITALAASGWWLACGLAAVSGFVLRRWLGWQPSGEDAPSPAPYFLIGLPLAALVLQLLLAAPLRDMSRYLTMANATEMIAEIEEHRETHGSYPASLHAVWQDYSPGVVGIAEYDYVPSTNAYNLVFEQPRFLLDDFGAREFVVYNSAAEHFMISHDSWILFFSPSELLANQGWFSRQPAGAPNWVSFLFD